MKKRTFFAVIAGLGGSGCYVQRLFSRIWSQITFDADQGELRSRIATPEIDVRIAELSASSFQIEHTAYLAAPPEVVFSYISTFENIKDWMPGLTKTWTDNERAEEPGGKGAVRNIRAIGGKMTYETVRHMERSEYFLYSASDKSLGGMFTSHIGAQICLPEGEGTRFIWRSYAVPAKNPLMRVISKYIFLYFVGQSVINLEKRFGC